MIIVIICESGAIELQCALVLGHLSKMVAKSALRLTKVPSGGRAEIEMINNCPLSDVFILINSSFCQDINEPLKNNL